MEGLISDIYPRTPVFPPFMLHGDDPTSALLRERAFLLGLPPGAVPPPSGPPQFARGGPLMWRPHPGGGFPSMEPNDMYSFLAASGAYPPWYSAALAAQAASGFRGGPPGMPPTTTAAAAFALASSPHFWSAAAAASSPGAQQSLPLGLTPRTPMIPSSPPMRPSATAIPPPPQVDAHHRFAPYIFASPKKETSSSISDCDNTPTSGPVAVTAGSDIHR